MLPIVGDGQLRSDPREKLAGLQYLRAIAALAVVFYHTCSELTARSAWMDFGAAGVDLFFVISGFVMALTTSPPTDRQGNYSEAVSFFIRRFFRIVPLYWIALTWTARSDLVAGRNLGHLAMDYLFLPHFSTYRATSIWPKLVPGWTLNYEMFFYLLFAIGIALGRFRYAFITAAIALLGFAGLVEHQGAMARFYTNPVMCEFVFGIALFHLYRRFGGLAMSRWIAGCVFITAVLMLLAPNMGPRLLWDGVPAFAIAASAIPLFRGSSSRLGLLLGDASYAIYLFHLPSFGGARLITNTLQFDNKSPVGTIGIFIVFMTVATVAGCLVHLFVEKPLLRLSKRFRDRRSSLQSKRLVSG